MAEKKRRAIPDYRLPIIESHCHLDSLSVDLPDLLRQCQQLNIHKLITIATSKTNQQSVADLTCHASVYATQGIHPHEAGDFCPSLAQEMRARIASNAKIVAVGEIGLDYYYDHCDRQQQRAAFAAQLQLAIECNLPIVIHTRDADADTQAILQEHAAALLAKSAPLGVIHSFTSSLALAEFCLEMGFALGFNGICTFNNADNVREVIRHTPLAQMLLETDSPYLTPVPYRGRENAPIYLPFIAEKIAEVKNLPVSDILSHCHANTERTFFAA